ncbi:MAG: hypothetical protein QG641_170, partial [Candidatus Poribacteria bacterium]|nr:hypothetical protein [Candidatus Poribacteria bacterium]
MEGQFNSEVFTMAEEPIQYTDMSERDFIKWNLDYTMGQTIEFFEAIPPDHLCIRPMPNINAPGWIFGHIITAERAMIGGFTQGVMDIPRKYVVFSGLWSIPTELQLRDVLEPKDDLISYWHEVRKQTNEYLDQLTDADLKKIPEVSILPDNDSLR